MDSKNNKKENEIVFFIEKKQHKTTEDSLTVRQILVDYAKVNVNKYFLVLKKGNSTNEYENLDEIIQLQNGMKFVLFAKDPTTVS